MPIITIVVPTYNRAHLLVKSVQSVLNQTFEDFVLFILDNASQDNTQEVVESFEDKRIRYVKNATNYPVHENWNRAFNLIDTEYLIIFHDDDMMKPLFLERHLGVITQSDDLVLGSTNMEYIDANDNILQDNALDIKKDIFFNQYKLIRDFYKKGIYLPCPTVIYRSSFIRENNLRFRGDVGPGFDIFFWFEANLKKAKIYLLHETLVQYRFHGQNYDWLKVNLLLTKSFLLYLKEYGNKKIFKLVNKKSYQRYKDDLCNRVNNGDTEILQLLNDFKKDGLWGRGCPKTNKWRVPL